MASLASSQVGLGCTTSLSKLGRPDASGSRQSSLRQQGFRSSPHWSPAPLQDRQVRYRKNRVAPAGTRRSSGIQNALTEERSAAPKPESVDALQTTDEEEQCKPIWFSSVIPKRYHKYFFNRTWSTKDKVFLGMLAVLHGGALFAPFTFSWDAFGLFFTLYVVSTLGITLSYHRNLTHKSFQLPKWLEYTFAYCGAQALQGDPIQWISRHRHHHVHCDTDLDPHTPYDGFWYCHLGWMLRSDITDERAGNESNAKDIARDPFYKFLQQTYFFHPIAFACLLYALGGFPYLVWGMALRICLVYHVTWAVNSAGHVWGGQPWNTGDLSTNNVPVGILALGEGWHNNHHAFEYSARHGLFWWQLDVTWLVISLLEKAGLATNILLPRESDMKRLSKPVPST